MPETGMIYEADNIKRQLLEANRDYNGKQSWLNAYQSVNTGASQAQQSLQTDYSTAANEAYSSFLSNKTALDNSGIVGAGKDRLDSQNTSALQEAYNTYMNKFQGGSAEIEKQRVDTNAALDKTLNQEAENYKKYGELHTDYLQYLYDTKPELFESKQWSRYLTDEIDTEGKIIEGQKRLMTKEELNASKKDEFGNEIGLYDSTGNLTIKGVDFFDQIENSPDLYNNSFSKFLAESDIEALVEQGHTKTEAEQIAKQRKELYDWSQEYNAWNWTEDGRKKGSFRNAVGLDSTDDKYSFIERFGGMNEKEIDTLYKSFHDSIKNMDKVDLGEDGKGQVENLRKATTDVFKVATDLGIDGHLKKEGFNEDVLTGIMDKALKDMKSGGEMNAEWWTKTLTGAGIGGILAGKYAAVLTAPANAVPLYGQAINVGATIIGSMIGAVGGGVISGIGATSDKNSQKITNKEKAQESKEAYLKMITEMTKYSQQMRRQAEIDYITGIRK